MSWRSHRPPLLNKTRAECRDCVSKARGYMGTGPEDSRPLALPPKSATTIDRQGYQVLAAPLGAAAGPSVSSTEDQGRGGHSRHPLWEGARSVGSI